MPKAIFITGCAGFIGFHLAQRLLAQGEAVVGLDNLNDYYDPKLKKDRLELLGASAGRDRAGRFDFVHADLADLAAIRALFEKHRFEHVLHMGAQAGVRYSIDRPELYLRSNIDGTFNILEACREASAAYGVSPSLVFASSSSVYGLSDRLPFSEDDPADRPTSLYGATKRADELMAHSYSHLYGLPITALRFFTVYGPWGRPDMALHKFVKSILKGEPIDVYNNGDMVRDFTYVDDIVDGTLALLRVRSALAQPGYDVFNIGCGQPRKLGDFIAAIESAVGRKALKKNLPFQKGDVHQTSADIGKIQKVCGYKAKVEVEEGVRRFVDWYRGYYPE